MTVVRTAATTGETGEKIVATEPGGQRPPLPSRTNDPPLEWYVNGRL